MSRNRIEVEECRIFDINVLKEVCKYGGDTGVYRWLYNGEVDARMGYVVYMHDAERGFVNLSYVITYTQNSHRHSFQIQSSPCNYGGFRYWVICPYCNRKVRKLYLPPNDEYFACRYCLKLTYESKSKNYHRPFCRYLDMVFKVEKIRSKTKRFIYKGQYTRNARRLMKYSCYIKDINP
jgi:hypothetical protein